ncbi:hypothetical protein DKE52_013995 [Acinetobacter pittii]|uniref:DUF4760 domain-containing protein n=1 Tax=Acinetobacter pittii TaxID=48296 RepID=A0A3G6YKA1_ACIPI|nr:hypothetical protein DKE52_013995 [Acinetobacter pittii]
MYSHNNANETLKESFTITISFFSALATIGAAIIALKLYTDWRDPIKLQNKFEFYKFSKELFSDFWVKASEYINSDLDTRVKITSINLEKNQRAAIEFNRCFYCLKSNLNEFDLYFNRNEAIPLKQMNEILDSFFLEMKKILPLEIKEKDDNSINSIYMQQYDRLMNSLENCQKFYTEQFLIQILSQLKDETR